MQNQYALETAVSTTEPREVATLHIDKKQSVMHESLNDLTGESASNRIWMFVNDLHHATVKSTYSRWGRLRSTDKSLVRISHLETTYGKKSRE